MRRWLVGSLAMVVVTALCAALTLAEAAPTAPGRDRDRLDAYTATVAPSQLSVIAEQGLDVTGQRRVKGGLDTHGGERSNHGGDIVEGGAEGGPYFPESTNRPKSPPPGRFTASARSTSPA